MSSRGPSSPPTRGSKSDRTRHLKRGEWAEWGATMLLRLKGYRILARRHRTPYGEIDIVAVRGRRLAFVEVKRRNDFAEAEAALTPWQVGRIGRAADDWIARHPSMAGHEIGLDAILVVGGALPRHLKNALDRF